MTISITRPQRFTRRPQSAPQSTLQATPEWAPQTTLEATPESTQTRAMLNRPTAQLRKRDRYIDVLRALALVRVMTYHVFGWAWLPIVFPSIGVMFAFAGFLIAGSLDRSPSNPWRVLKRRAIRLLPPVWLLGLVAVPIMLLAGWTHSATAGVPLRWQTLAFWIVPISDPPGSQFGDDWVTPLWYVRAYLWFVLLSPAALWLFRHWPKRIMAVPLTIVLLSATDLLPLSGRSGEVILSIAMFGGCWMLGFAHHDNKIRPVPLVKVLIGGASLMALGLMWALSHPDPITSYDISNIPLADTLYCLGAVLILLRLHSEFSWMDRRVVLDKIITVISSRAMTLYLWGNFAIFLTSLVLSSWSVTSALEHRTAGWIQTYVVSWLILIVCVFAFGWCEDLAARRPLRINPWPRSTQQLETMRTRRVLTFSGPALMADLTPRRLFLLTSGLLAAAAALSAVVLTGTDTPGRANPADVQSRDAVNPRPDTTPPPNLGRGNGQRSEVTDSLSKVGNAILGGGNDHVQPVNNSPSVPTVSVPPGRAPTFGPRLAPAPTGARGATGLAPSGAGRSQPVPTGAARRPGGQATQPVSPVAPSPRTAAGSPPAGGGAGAIPQPAPPVGSKPGGVGGAPPAQPVQAPRPAPPVPARPNPPVQAPPAPPIQAPPNAPVQAPPNAPVQAPPNAPVQAPPAPPVPARPNPPVQAPPAPPVPARPNPPVQAPPVPPVPAPPAPAVQAPPNRPVVPPPTLGAPAP